MRSYNYRRARLGAAFVAASLAVASAASAQTAAAPQVATGPYDIPIQSWQGLGCLYGSVIAGLGVFYYQDELAVAVSGVTNPLLMIPLVATGALAGCVFGYNSAPGLVWLYRQL
jgi:hypothetical protein